MERASSTLLHHQGLPYDAIADPASAPAAHSEAKTGKNTAIHTGQPAIDTNELVTIGEHFVQTTPETITPEAATMAEVPIPKGRFGNLRQKYRNAKNALMVRLTAVGHGQAAEALGKNPEPTAAGGILGYLTLARYGVQATRITATLLAQKGIHIDLPDFAHLPSTHESSGSGSALSETAAGHHGGSGDSVFTQLGDGFDRDGSNGAKTGHIGPHAYFGGVDAPDLSEAHTPPDKHGTSAFDSHATLKLQTTETPQGVRTEPLEPWQEDETLTTTGLEKGTVTHEVADLMMKEYGYSRADIDALRENGILGNVANRVLEHNGLSQEEAAQLPVGYQAEVPNDVITDIKNMHTYMHPETQIELPDPESGGSHNPSGLHQDDSLTSQAGELLDDARELARENPEAAVTSGLVFSSLLGGRVGYRRGRRKERTKQQNRPRDTRPTNQSPHSSAQPLAPTVPTPMQIPDLTTDLETDDNDQDKGRRRGWRGRRSSSTSTDTDRGLHVRGKGPGRRWRSRWPGSGSSSVPPGFPGR